jgi:hypothetical protein
MPLEYPTRPGDVDRLIADDLAVVRRQLRFLAAEAGDRQVLTDQVGFQLTLLLNAVQRVLAESGDPAETARAMLELLVTIDQSEPGEDDFETALTRLDVAFQAYAAEQEGDLLPGLRKTAGAPRMAELGRQYLAAKRSAPTHPHLRAATTGIAQPAAALFDRLRDGASGRVRTLATDPSGTLDPQAQRLIDVYASLLSQLPELLDVEQARKQPTLADAVTALIDRDGRPAGPEPVGDVHTVPAEHGPMRVYHPTGTPTDPLPIVLWIRRGGWVVPEADLGDAASRGLVNPSPCRWPRSWCPRWPRPASSATRWPTPRMPGR